MCICRIQRGSFLEYLVWDTYFHILSFLGKKPPVKELLIETFNHTSVVGWLRHSVDPQWIRFWIRTTPDFHTHGHRVFHILSPENDLPLFLAKNIYWSDHEIESTNTWVDSSTFGQKIYQNNFYQNKSFNLFCTNWFLSFYSRVQNFPFLV